MASQMASAVRRAALRRRCLSLAKSISIGLRVGGVFRQEEELGAGIPDGLTDGLAAVRAEIVQDHDIARPESGDEHLLDIEAEALAVDRSVEKPGRVDAILSQRRQEGHGLPAAVRHLGPKSLATRRPAPQRRHVGLSPGLVDEHQAGRIDPGLTRLPLHSPPGDVGAVLLAGDQRLFL